MLKVKYERVKASDIRLGPVRHEALTPNQLERARAIHAALAPHIGPFETFELNLLRDVRIDRELGVYEQIVDCFQKYSAAHQPFTRADGENCYIALCAISLGVIKRSKSIPSAMWSDLQTLSPWRQPTAEDVQQMCGEMEEELSRLAKRRNFPNG